MALPNPAGCCELDVDCCENRLPEILIATFQNDGGCPKVDGLQLELKWNAGTWDGFDPDLCGSEGAQAELQCIAAATCDHFDLDFDIGFGVTGSGLLPEPGCSCDPLNLVYKAIADSGKLSDCCEELTTVELTITITEA